MIIPRLYENLQPYLKPNKALLLFGPRRVGKTTLVENYLKTTRLSYKLDSGDNVRVQEILSSLDFNTILPYIQNYELYVIDEAQLVPNIGQALKIMVDQIPDIQIIATGSSSFELAGQVGEPLTGRKRSLTLYPVSAMELSSRSNNYELQEYLPTHLVYGCYPEIIKAQTNEEKITQLREIVDSYLLKDILELEQVKGSKLLLDLLRLIAFQVGSEVSLTELGSSLGIDYKTVARYLDLFEKAFILYNLRGYSRNLRSEITKKSKYYFYDNGVRNAVISNFNPLNLRDDTGKLWENYLVTERLKAQQYVPLYANNFFWRTWEHHEIDWVEEREGTLFGYEFKFSPKQKKYSHLFKQIYPKATVEVINSENYLPFVGVQE